MTTPRGIRNRNPGNIRYTAGAKWVGLDEPPTDGSFCRFRSDQEGIRALGVLLRNYRKRYGLKSIDQIIGRWAPPNENNTKAYAAAVAARFDASVQYEPNLDDARELETLIRAIVRHENGPGPLDDQEWYTDLIYRNGVRMVLEPMSKSRTVVGSVTAGSALVAQAVLDTAQQYIPVAVDVGTTVEPIWPEVVKWIFIAVGIAGAVLAFYARWSAREAGER